LPEAQNAQTDLSYRQKYHGAQNERAFIRRALAESAPFVDQPMITFAHCSYQLMLAPPTTVARLKDSAQNCLSICSGSKR